MCEPSFSVSSRLNTSVNRVLTLFIKSSSCRTDYQHFNRTSNPSLFCENVLGERRNIKIDKMSKWRKAYTCVYMGWEVECRHQYYTKAPTTEICLCCDGQFFISDWARPVHSGFYNELNSLSRGLH